MSAIVARIRRQFSDARPAKRAGLVLLALAAFTVAGTSAWAYWTTFGSGSASATTGTLNPPTGVAASNTTGSSTVGVSWTASVGPTTPTGYYVTRIRNIDSARFAACATTPTGLTAGPSCNDLIVPDGTFHYAVTAVYNSWTATGTSNNNVSVSTAITGSKLAFTTEPIATAISQTAFAIQPVVKVQDAFGNTATTDTSLVTLALTNPAGATVACTMNPQPVVAGAATFTGCQIDKVGTYTLTATDGSLTSAASTSVTISPGVAAVVATQAGSSQSATVNTAFAATLAAKVTDSFGNPVPGVLVTFTAPGSGASGKFANSTVTTSASTDGGGIAAATAFTANITAGSYTVSASASGATSASFALTNNPGLAARLIFGQQPTGVGKTTAISPSVTVRILDQFGNPTGSALVTLTLNNPGNVNGANLTGNAVNAVNGVATFPALTVNKAGTFSLNATSTGLTTVISSSFTMT